MKLIERSYNSKSIRPKPATFVETDGSLVVVATSWGHFEHAQRVVDEVSKYMSAARADVEVTSPFEFLSCLTDEVNYLRTAILIANEALYRSENKSEYQSGVEVLVLYRKESQVAWAQVGAPSLLLKRKDLALQPISTPLDFSVDLSRDGLDLPPLPGQMLGLEPTCDIKVGHIYCEESDKLILLAGSRMATSLWIPGIINGDLNEITQKITQENPELPFWLGVVTADGDAEVY